MYPTAFCRISGRAIVPPVVVCLAALMLVLNAVAVEAATTCPYIRIQETCRTQNEALVKAEEVKHDHPNKLCTPLVDLFTCIAGMASSACLQEFIGVYKKYLHSPHNCSISPEVIRKLQDLSNRNSGQEGGRGRNGDVGDVDVIPLDGTSPSPSTAAEDSSASVRDDGDDDDGGGGGVDDGSVTVGDNKKGDTHKQTGNTGSSISLFCGVPLAVTSWLATLRVTSHLLRS